MDKIYNVLWIEDEPGKMDGFKLTAKYEGIILDQFNTSKKGIEALEKGISKYDAVILDAKGYDESEDEAQELTGLHSSIIAIAGLEKQYNRKIQYFIFTGQPDLMADSSFRSLHKKTPIYSKNKDEDVEEMFRKIKEFADDDENIQLKYRYSDVLEICTDKYIGENRFKRVFGLIQFVENRNFKAGDAKGILGEARKVVEHIFEKLNLLGVIPDEIWKSTGKLNRSQRFLQGNLTDEYQYNEDIFHPLIGALLGHVLLFQQDEAHSEGELKLKADSFLAYQNTGYFVKGVLAQLFEILVYVKKFVDEHQDVKANRSLYEKKIIENSNEKYVSGVVVQQSANKDRGGYAFLKPEEGENIYIPKKLVDKHKLTDGIQIKSATMGKGSKSSELKSIDEIV